MTYPSSMARAHNSNPSTSFLNVTGTHYISLICIASDRMGYLYAYKLLILILYRMVSVLRRRKERAGRDIELPILPGLFVGCN